MKLKSALFASIAAGCFALVAAPASAASTSAKATAEISTLVGCSVSNSTNNPAPMTCHDVFGNRAMTETSDGFVAIMDTPVQLS